LAFKNALEKAIMSNAMLPEASGVESKFAINHDRLYKEL